MVLSQLKCKNILSLHKCSLPREFTLRLSLNYHEQALEYNTCFNLPAFAVRASRLLPS